MENFLKIIGVMVFGFIVILFGVLISSVFILGILNVWSDIL